MFLSQIFRSKKNEHQILTILSYSELSAVLILRNDKVIYQIQASQWAIRAKVHMRRKRTAAPYSE